MNWTKGFQVARQFIEIKKFMCQFSKWIVVKSVILRIFTYVKACQTRYSYYYALQSLYNGTAYDPTVSEAKKLR